MADLKDPINRFYYGYLINTPDALEILSAQLDNAEYHLLACIREAFTAGARWELRTSAELSPHIAHFLEMVILLGPDPGRDEWMRHFAPRDEPNTLEDLPFDAPDDAPYEHIDGPSREPYDAPFEVELRDDIPF